METVALDKNKHDRTHFDCGVSLLNNYLSTMASQQAKKDNTRTFILEDETHPTYIVGYYTLTMTPIDFKKLPARLKNKHHGLTSAALIARLAIDSRYKGKGLGEWLLIDALRKLLMASETVAFPVVIVDSKEGAIDFYSKYGFTAFEDIDNKLFITIADIRKSIGSLI